MEPQPLLAQLQVEVLPNQIVIPDFEASERNNNVYNISFLGLVLCSFDTVTVVNRKESNVLVFMNV